MIDKIKRYEELKQQEKDIKEEIEKLNKDIKDWMLYKVKQNETIIGGYNVKIQSIDFRKFKDDIIPFLKLNGFKDLIEVKEVFNYDKLKKLIKEGKIDKNSLDRFRDNKGKKSLNLYIRKIK